MAGCCGACDRPAVPEAYAPDCPDLFGHPLSAPPPGKPAGRGPWPGGVVNCPLDPIGPEDARGRRQLAAAKRAAARERASAAWRGAISRRILPRLRALRPDLVVVSAGFDASEHDRYYWLGEDDFAWAARAITGAAGPRCGVVSVLEGGYATRVRPGARQAAGNGTAEWSPGDSGLGRCVRAFVDALGDV